MVNFFESFFFNKKYTLLIKHASILLYTLWEPYSILHVNLFRLITPENVIFTQNNSHSQFFLLRKFSLTLSGTFQMVCYSHLKLSTALTYSDPVAEQLWGNIENFLIAYWCLGTDFFFSLQTQPTSEIILQLSFGWTGLRVLSQNAPEFIWAIMLSPAVFEDLEVPGRIERDCQTNGWSGPLRVMMAAEMSPPWHPCETRHQALPMTSRRWCLQRSGLRSFFILPIWFFNNS